MTTILTPREAEALDNHAEQQARAQLSSIREMLAADSLDWDRLEELREERENLAYDLENAETDHAEAIRDGEDIAHALKMLGDARDLLADWDRDNTEELSDLEAAAGDFASQEEALQAMLENPLEISFRSGWGSAEDLQPEEFQILLCTGGPAVRIIGELGNHGEPCRAWIEYQDWGTPWTMLFEGQSDALDYAQRVICL